MLRSSLCIIGKIASGKSTVAKRLSEDMQYPIASFGHYLADLSSKSSLPTDRTSLQNLGNKFIKEKPEQFLKDVISFSVGSSNSIIMEGVRHLKICELMKELSETCFFVFIDASPQIRYQRFLTRKKIGDADISFEEFCVKDQHEVEQEIDSLRQFCNVINSENLTIEQIVEQIKSDFLYR